MGSLGHVADQFAVLLALSLLASIAVLLTCTPSASERGTCLPTAAPADVVSGVLNVGQPQSLRSQLALSLAAVSPVGEN